MGCANVLGALDDAPDDASTLSSSALVGGKMNLYMSSPGHVLSVPSPASQARQLQDKHASVAFCCSPISAQHAGCVQSLGKLSAGSLLTLQEPCPGQVAPLRRGCSSNSLAPASTQQPPLHGSTCGMLAAGCGTDYNCITTTPTTRTNLHFAQGIIYGQCEGNAGAAICCDSALAPSLYRCQCQPDEGQGLKGRTRLTRATCCPGTLR